MSIVLNTNLFKYNDTFKLLKDYSNIYKRSLEDIEIESIYNYSKNDYRETNLLLRNNTRIESNPILSQVPYIDSALDKFYFDKPFTVYRKLHLGDKLYGTVSFWKYQGIIKDIGYQSTSLLKDAFVLRDADLFLEIKIENPSCGAYICPIAWNKIEEEFLIKRKTPIIIDKIDNRNLNTITIKGRVR